MNRVLLALEVAVPERARLFFERACGVISGCGSLPIPPVDDAWIPWIGMAGAVIVLAVVAFLVLRSRCAGEA